MFIYMGLVDRRAVLSIYIGHIYIDGGTRHQRGWPGHILCMYRCGTRHQTVWPGHIYINMMGLDVERSTDHAAEAPRLAPTFRERCGLRT